MADAREDHKREEHDASKPSNKDVILGGGGKPGGDRGSYDVILGGGGKPGGNSGSYAVGLEGEGEPGADDK